MFAKSRKSIKLHPPLSSSFNLSVLKITSFNLHRIIVKLMVYSLVPDFFLATNLSEEASDIGGKSS
jgi:hypothetical protein